MEFFVCAAVLLVAFADVGDAASWSYDGETGPEFWHKLFPQACSGKYQSPVDIRPEQSLYNPDLKEFAMWYDPPRPDSRMAVLNNGHTVQVVTQGELYVTNGGLPNVFKTAQFHFHWGHAKHHGSEHLIDGNAYPLELHIVNYNKDLYKTIGEAATEKQGLAVLGVMFEISEDDNPSLEPIIEAMEEVRDPEEGRQVEIDPLSLRSLLPEDMTRYFRYNGSLTTPGCFESVIWTVFEQPRPISRRQMRVFREMLQMRPSRSHHKRSLEDPMPLSRSGRARERRALDVLTELGITTQAEKDRFRRELKAHKANAEHEVHMNEENAGRTYSDTMDHVRDEPAHDDHDDPHGFNAVVEVEMEYMQEKLVNNFRPVQPLNGRLVFRSFKLREEGGRHHGHHGKGHHGGHGDGHGDGHGSAHGSGHGSSDDPAEMEKRLKYYEAVGGASSLSLASLSMLLLSCLVALSL